MRIGVQLPEVERVVRWAEMSAIRPTAGVDEAILVTDPITERSVLELAGTFA